MNLTSFPRLVAAALLATAAACGASSTPATTPPPAPSSSSTITTEGSTAPKPAGEATIGDTTRCPVSGDEFVVSASSPKVEHEGKTYYFCCPGCAAKFAKDPSKFLAPK